MSAIVAALLSNLVPTLVALVGAALAWAATKITASIDSKNKAAAAAARLGQVGLALAGSIWSKVGPEVQARMADGAFSAEDREAVLALVKDEIDLVDLGDTVSDIAKALGLPLSGVIGTIAEWIVNRYANAHSTSNADVSAKAYPVASSALPPKGLGSGGT